MDSLFDLNRPEYGASPEAILSELAWSLFDKSERDAPLAYEKAGSGVKTRFRVDYTRPAGEEIQGLLSRLSENGVGLGTGNPILVNTLLDSIRGFVPEKAGAFPVVPLVPPIAFLQDARGIQRKNNPANYARIVEQMYRLGGREPISSRAAASAWFNILRDEEHDPLFQELDKFFSNIGPVSKGKVNLSESRDHLASDTLVGPTWVGELETPFSWFRKNWDRLCKKEWRDAMPRRRWCDWATCLLRTAFGMGFLWEARLYRRISESLTARQGEVDPEHVLGMRDELLVWGSPEDSVSARDVNGYIKQTVAMGYLSRKIINEDLLPRDPDFQLKLEDPSTSLVEIISGLRSALAKYITDNQGDNPFSDLIEKRPRSGGKNIHETVVYSLQCRVDTGRDADFYSLLARRSRRFLVVEPGPEWIVVLASLAAGEPGGVTTLGQLSRELHMLGLRPPREILVRELERAGLSRSSHDSDDALEVIAAF